MTPRKSQPIAQAAYDQLAEPYAELVDKKPHNAYYEKPATLSLLPDVQGKRMLDAGCGPGAYTEWLVQHGARVVAIDANAKMVHFAKKRLGEQADIRQADLEQPLDFLPDASFDVIVCPLVMDYVRDWYATFMEFHRILKAGGCFVFSMEHPFIKFFDYREAGKYFNIERVEYTWRGFGKPVKVPSYRRPMSKVVNPLIKAGFTLDCLLEPLPTEEFKHVAPDDYEELTRQPGFLCVRAYKGSPA